MRGFLIPISRNLVALVLRNPQFYIINKILFWVKYFRVKKYKLKCWVQRQIIIGSFTVLTHNLEFILEIKFLWKFLALQVQHLVVSSLHLKRQEISYWEKICQSFNHCFQNPHISHLHHSPAMGLPRVSPNSLRSLPHCTLLWISLFPLLFLFFLSGEKEGEGGTSAISALPIAEKRLCSHWGLFFLSRYQCCQQASTMQLKLKSKEVT